MGSSKESESGGAVRIEPTYMNPRFLLYCGADSEYTLAKEQEDWRREFGSMHKALDYAQSLTQVPTPIAVYSATGKEIIQGTINPRRDASRP